MQIISIVFLFCFAVQCNCICQCVSYYGKYGSEYTYMHGCDDFESQALCFRAERSFKKAGEDLLFSVLEQSNATDTDFIIQLEKFENLLRQSVPAHDCFGALRTETVWRNVLCQSSKLVEECERMKNSASEWSTAVLDMSKSIFSLEKQAQLRGILQKQDAISIDCSSVRIAIDTNECAPKSLLSALVVCVVAIVVAIAQTVYNV